MEDEYGKKVWYCMITMVRLVDERDAIYVPSNITKKTISRLQDMGYLCVLATGRALSYIPSGAKDLHLDGYVTCNGAYDHGAWIK